MHILYKHEYNKHNVIICISHYLDSGMCPLVRQLADLSSFGGGKLTQVLGKSCGVILLHH